MTFDEMMEDIKSKHPELRHNIELAEAVADFAFENDMVEVVRCKDCNSSYFYNGSFRCQKFFEHGRGWPGRLVDDDNYCCWGRRREDKVE